MYSSGYGDLDAVHRGVIFDLAFIPFFFGALAGLVLRFGPCLDDPWSGRMWQFGRAAGRSSSI